MFYHGATLQVLASLCDRVSEVESVGHSKAIFASTHLVIPSRSICQEMESQIFLWNALSAGKELPGLWNIPPRDFTWKVDF